MRSLLDLPAGRRITSQLADWAETSTLFRDDKSISREDIVRALVQERGGLVTHDEDDLDAEPMDIHPAKFDEKARELAEGAFEELRDRQSALGNEEDSAPERAYPFEVDVDVLRLTKEFTDLTSAEIIYVFLLAITRASMESKSRKLAGFDPTKLFERLCADVLTSFWRSGDQHSGTFVVGTSSDEERPPFSELIDNLCESLHDGEGWNPNAESPGAGDGGLDIVVWRRFSDNRAGSLVGFAQCKTGDHWAEHLGKRNPHSVCHRFLRRPLVIDPLQIYMVPCRIDAEVWDQRTRENAGILFDRCRIAHYSDKVNTATVSDIQEWLNAAIDRQRSRVEARLKVELTDPEGKS